jgi:hypothetical protein
MKPMMKCGCAANATCSAMGGVKFDPPIPSCAIHDCIEQAPSVNLEGRQAKCPHCKTLVKSSMTLAFFEYWGEGSPSALYHCKHCGYYESAHVDPKAKHLVSRVCDHFEPHGAYEFDSYYCGCRGWD